MHSRFDEKIITEWADRKARHRKKHKPFTKIALIVLAVSVLVFIFFKNSYLLIPIPFCAVYLIIDQLIENLGGDLKCPNCGKSPCSSFTRESAFDVDFCRHCKCWLIHPINNSDFYC
jgi:hypothetical protein